MTNGTISVVRGDFQVPAQYIMHFYISHILTSVQWSAWLTHTRQHPPTYEVRPLYVNELPEWTLLIFIFLKELKADVQRQQRVLMNASLIEAQDQEERARSRPIGPSDMQEHAPRAKVSSSSESPPNTRDNAPLTSSSHSRVNPPRRPTSDLPNTGPDRTDEPQSWTPRARSRDN
jgi:NADH dehydrogenase [ubiquinone] 1 alpha subcomplex assembly factor 2